MVIRILLISLFLLFLSSCGRVDHSFVVSGEANLNTVYSTQFEHCYIWDDQEEREKCGNRTLKILEKKSGCEKNGLF